jgi:hypothetical protein
MRLPLGIAISEAEQVNVASARVRIMESHAAPAAQFDLAAAGGRILGFCNSVRARAAQGARFTIASARVRVRHGVLQHHAKRAARELLR